MAVSAMMALRMVGDWLSTRDLVRIVSPGGRMSMVMATGGHFASAVAAARMSKGWGGRLIQVLSATEPLPDLVARLNAVHPAVVAPYASMAALLAGEQEAGRLRIAPVLMALAAEGLPLSDYRKTADVFGAKVGNSYAATECTFLSYSCEHDWLHVNADWAILEPVDADLRPAPPGTPSHTVLLSNLANRVQPILRYDLGDSVLARPDPCPCGNPLPAIRVQGRSGEILSFAGEDGRASLSPLSPWKSITCPGSSCSRSCSAARRASASGCVSAATPIRRPCGAPCWRKSGGCSLPESSRTSRSSGRKGRRNSPAAANTGRSFRSAEAPRRSKRPPAKKKRLIL